MEDDARQEFWSGYTADMLCAISANLIAIGGGKPQPVYYTDLIDPDKKHMAQDTRTADEIKADILAKLQG